MLVVKEKYVNKLLFLFFFSSRRRHTRSKRDWSSDVCSSDLLPFTPRQRSGTSRAVALAKAGVRARVALWWQPCRLRPQAWQFHRASVGTRSIRASALRRARDKIL